MPQTAITRGPLVWRDMDQKALDDAYDQDVYAPNRQLIVTRRIAASERARANSRAAAARRLWAERIRAAGYLSRPARAGRTSAPVNVFIHGGAWRRNKARRLSRAGRAAGAAPARIASSSTSSMSSRPAAI